MDEILQYKDVHIPENILKYIDNYDGANLQININTTSGMNGYGGMVWFSVIVSRITRTCHRCGYDLLWNPDDSGSKCLRHSYDAWRYDVVFEWYPKNCTLTLEQAFDDFLENQPSKYSEKPVVKKTYGDSWYYRKGE